MCDTIKIQGLGQLVIQEVQELVHLKQSNLFGLVTERLYLILGPCHAIGNSHHLHKPISNMID